MGDSQWSGWYPLTAKCPAGDVPDMPGAYEIRTDYEFGRLRGTSRIVWIGSAGRGKRPSLRERIVGQRIGDPGRYLSRTEKLLRQAGHDLEFRFATAIDGKTAREMEGQRLMDYEKKHWELPPGNGVLPIIGRQK